MTNSTVHLLVACTSRKRKRPSSELRLRSVRRAPATRATCWLERVEASTKDIAAHELYSGDSWYVARRVDDTFDEADLWALSAGFGLVRSNDLVASYDATLTPGSPDSVSRPDDRVSPKTMRRRWWRELSSWRGPSDSAAPRSIAELAGASPGGAIVVSAGSDYLDAAMDDLVDASRRLCSPERLLVLGSGYCPAEQLGESWVSLPAKLRTVVGGSLGSLSVRAAERILQDGGVDVTAGSARRVIERLAAGAPDIVTVERRRMSDDEVADWIAGELATDGALTKTVALRRLRERGFACEQTRFGQLFAEVSEVLV